MAQLENYTPLLREGRIQARGSQIVYETTDPFDQVVLPAEAADFLVYCNGQNSMSEIVEKMYKQHGYVRFRIILQTLSFLKEREFLANAEELEIDQDSSNRPNLLMTKPPIEIPLSRRIISETPHPLMFYILTMCLILSSILSLESYAGSWLGIDFLRIQNSFSMGLLNTFLIASGILSVKYLIKTVLLLMISGRAYNFKLQSSGFSLHFAVSSDSLFLVTNRLYRGLFHLASVLLPLVIGALASSFVANEILSNNILQIASLLFLFEMRPFGSGELIHFLESFYPNENLRRITSYHSTHSVFNLTHPTNPKVYKVINTLAIIASAIWTVSVSVFGIHCLIAYSFPIASLIFDFKPDGFFGLYSLTIFGSIAFGNIYNFYSVGSMNFYKYWTYLTRNLLKNKMSEKIDIFNEEEVSKIIEDLPLFSYFPQELLNMLVQKSEIARHEKGAPVVVQGSEGKELFVLLKGLLTVQRNVGHFGVQNVGDIQPRTIFGEVAVLEETTRAADIIAKENSVVLSIPAKALRQAAQDNQYVRELESFRNAIVVNQFFNSAPYFRDLSDRVMQMFLSRGKFESFQPEQFIFKQGDPGNGFYLLLRGHVGVSVNSQVVGRIAQGGFFGEISLIADVPRTGAVFAQDHVQTLHIGRDAFWDILSQDLNIAMFIESIGEMRILEDIEFLKGSKSKIA